MKKKVSKIKVYSFILGLAIMSFFFGCTSEEKFQLMDQDVKVNKDSLIFTYYEYDGLELSVNVGNLDYSLSGVPSWLSVNPANGNVSYGQPAYLNFSVGSTSNIVLEPLMATFKIHTSLKVFDVHVTLMPEYFTNRICSEFLSFKNSENSKEITLFNNNETAISWNAIQQKDWFEFSPSTGTLKPKQSYKVKVNLKRNLLPDQGNFNEVINIVANGKDNFVNVGIDNFENPMLLNIDVIDAEFVPAIQKVVLASTSPPAIHLYDITDESLQTIDLDYVPTTIHVRPDSKKLAVGHDARVSVIDLQQKKVEKVYSVDCKAFDVLYSMNDFIYVFPEKDQWTRLRCINTLSSEVLYHEGFQIYEGMRGVLSQDGQFIYAVDNFRFPQDVIKFDINDGKAIYLYDSPYHGDYHLGHDIWYLKDRNSIFSGRTFLKNTNDPNTDLRYDGILDLSKAFPVSQNVTSFAQSQDQSILFVGMNYPFLIHTNDKNVVASYNSKTGTYIKKYNLGYTGKDGSTTEAMPKFIWVQNNKLHVLIKDFYEEIYFIRSFKI